MTTAIQHNINFHALFQNPGELVEGSIWSAWWALGVYFSANSLYELSQAFVIEHPAAEKFTKIAMAVKNAFIDLLSLCSSSCYLLRWAAEGKVFSLGQYLPFIKNLCFGASAILYGTEACFDAYQISVESEAILKETSEERREPYKQRLNLALMRLIGNVCMVAWAALGMAALAGLAVSSLLTGLFLTAGTVFGVASIFYKYHLDNLGQQTSPGAAVAQ